MKWNFLGLLILLITSNIQAAALEAKTNYSELIVKYKASHFSMESFNSIDSQENLASFANKSLKLSSVEARLIHKDRTDHSLIFSIKLDTDSFSIKQQLESNPMVDWAFYNTSYFGEYREGDFVNDPKASVQTHLEQIDAYRALAIQWGQPNVVIAVTDDGFDLTHEDLAQSYHQNLTEIPGNGIDDDNNGYIDDTIGWNFNDGNNNPGFDYNYGAHGTHVAGIIAAAANNGIGGLGVAPGVKIMPLKFYGDKYWTSAMVLETYTYAVDNGARIITTSYNIDRMSTDPIYQKALDYAHDRGVLVFNSAGNNRSKNPPRSLLEKLLLVSSVETSATPSGRDLVSSFSNYGYQIDISAPGSNITSTGRRNTYVSMSGTSMATPVAAAVAGLIWSQNPEFNSRQVVHNLLSTTDNIDQKNPNMKNSLGSGRVNAYNSLSPRGDVLQISVPSLEGGIPLLEQNTNILVRFRGSPGFASGELYIQSLNKRTQAFRVGLQQEIALGTNQINYNLGKLTRGAYRLIIPAHSFIDPFGRNMDGDRDGASGGDYSINFQVQ